VTTAEDVQNATGPAGKPMLSMQDIHHSYGKTIALKNMSFEIYSGEIRGLIGENGSGKSTLVKLLSGVMPPTGGTISINGERVSFRSPRDAQRAGVITVFQETLISTESSVRDNIFIGQDRLLRRGASASAERHRALGYFETLCLRPSLLNGSVVQLSLAQRQILTITRALTRDWRLLILDESTSALDLQTRDRLFDLLRDEISGGRSVLFVSHRMDELQSFVNRATVLRSGAMVGTLEQAEATPDMLLRMMSHRTSMASLEHLEELPADTEGAPVPGAANAEVGAEPVRLRGTISLGTDAAPFEVSIKAGEVFGVAGLEGQGGATFLETLVGLRSPVTGSLEHVSSDGTARSARGYGRAVKDGIVYVPGNRQVEGLFAPLSVVDNTLMATMSRDTVAGLFRQRSRKARTREFVDSLAIEVADIREPVDVLSGGNQQKVLVSRWLAANPQVLVMNDPLRGVDLGTKRQFYRLLRRLAGEGVAVVLLSTEIEELVQVCDRVAVFREASVEAVLDRQEMGYDEILQAMFGQKLPVGASGADSGRDEAK
jgi:ribose transport system ATP-binding protein